MDYILHLETSTKACSVALSCNGKILKLKESITDAYSHSESLTLYIQEVMTAAGLEMNQLKAVSVTSGPGSYTGLRIGVSTAKGLCYALGIPLISVGTLAVLAQAVTQNNGLIVPMIDARRMEVYSAVFDQNYNKIKEVQAE